jgi:phosphatidylglycerophosphatase A
MRRGFARFVASGFGSGYAPVAPGTFGSLAALVLGALMLGLAPIMLPLAVILATLAGLWALRAGGVEKDPGWVVIDEFAGMWIAMLPLVGDPVRPLPLLVAFVAFRLFDIAKPGPIGWADRQGGPPGVMADDVMAGMAAAAVVWLAALAMPDWYMAPFVPEAWDRVGGGN